MTARATWIGTCTGCGREGVQVASSREHHERVLCQSCAARPYRLSAAILPEPTPEGTIGGHLSDQEAGKQVRAAFNGAGKGARTPGLRITRACDVRVEPVEFLFTERVPIGALTLVAGDPGLGKSTWTAGLAAEVTVGRHGPAAPVLIANAEDSPGHVIVPRLAAAGADLERVEFFAASDPASAAHERPFTLPGDVPRLEAHAQRVGARLVVIDPLNAHLGEDVSTRSDHSVRRALAPLAAMAQRLRIAVVVVAHLNKAQGTDAIYRVGGSIGLVGGARSLLVFTRDPDDPDGEDGDRRALGHVKSNWARLAPTLAYAHETTSVTAGGATVDTNRLVALSECGVAGTALLGTDQDDPPATKLERAEELLADLLGDGERHRAKEVKEAAKRQGIPERTLQRAAHDAGVSMESEGFPRVTYWSLDSRATPNGATGHGATGATGKTPVNTGQFAPSFAQSRQTQVNGATVAERCRCERPVPVPDPEDNELRCAACGRIGELA